MGAEESFSAAQEGRRGAGKRGRGKEGEEGKREGQLHPFLLLLWLQPGAFPGEPCGNPHTSVELQRRGKPVCQLGGKMSPGARPEKERKEQSFKPDGVKGIKVFR